MKQTSIEGIIPPLLTPLTGRRELDREAVARMIGHVASAGVHGIFLLGSTGEWASLPEAIRKELVIHGTAAAKGKLPVLVNITDTSVDEVRRKAIEAAEAGADYSVLAPPYYYAMNRKELEDFLQLAAKGSPLPLILYNAPQYTRNAIEPETVRVLAQQDHILGIKDSSGNMEYLNRLIHARLEPGFSILIGPEMLLSECLGMGCSGGVCGGANLFPRLYCELYKAARNGETALLEKLQLKIRRIHDEVYSGSDSALSHVLGLKYLMARRGLCHPHMAMPLYETISDSRKKIMDRLLEEYVATGY
jgi:4-hydroxy-tetrahydrodipicolinate synthase